MKNPLRKALMISLISLGALGVAAKVSGVFSKPEPSPIYEYAIARNLGKDIAQKAEKRLNPEFNENDRKFLDIISSYSKGLQEVCLSSDILDNGDISDAELESVRKAKLEGIVKNPEETYAVIANGNGSDNPDLYSQKNAEYSLANISSFYKFLKNNGVTDKNISLLVHNPTDIKLDGIKIDNKSNIINFSKAIKNSHTDYNDSIYIIYSNPGPDKSPGYHSLSNIYISFDGNPNLISLESDKKTRFYSFDLSDLLKKKYKKAVVIFNTWDSSNFLGNLDSSSTGDNPKNVLAISSPNEIGFYNETFMLDLVSMQMENPKRSIKELIDMFNKAHKGREESKVYFYNENGVKRSPEECLWYTKPLIGKGMQTAYSPNM